MTQSNEEQGGDGLRSKIRCALGYCEANQHECIFESSRNESQELDLIMQLILADRKQHELETLHEIIAENTDTINGTIDADGVFESVTGKIESLKGGIK